MEILNGKDLSALIKDDLKCKSEQFVQTPILAVITITFFIIKVSLSLTLYSTKI